MTVMSPQVPPRRKKNSQFGRDPEGCVENGPAVALLVGYVSI
jgi:hypothetical protein